MAPPDRIMPLVIVEDASALRAFYTEQLGFALLTDKSGEQGEGSFFIVAYATCALGFATPDALEGLPGLTVNAMVVIELPEVEPVHRVMAGRSPDVIGPLRDTPWGKYFEVTDPVGTRLRFLEVGVD